MAVTKAIRAASNRKRSQTIKKHHDHDQVPEQHPSQQTTPPHNSLPSKAMWPFSGFAGYPGYPGYAAYTAYPTYPGYPGYSSSSIPIPGWISTLDSRTNARSRYGMHTDLGSGISHHDLISFSLASAKEPSDETLVVMNPVRGRHFKGLQTSRLEALFEELSDLQEARTGNPGLGLEELEMRQMTIDALAEELQRRKQWSLDDDGEDADGDKEDE